MNFRCDPPSKQPNRRFCHEQSTTINEPAPGDRDELWDGMCLLDPQHILTVGEEQLRLPILSGQLVEVMCD